MLDYIIGSRIVFSFCNADHGVDNIVIAIGPLHHLIFAKMLSVTSKLIKRCKGSKHLIHVPTLCFAHGFPVCNVNNVFCFLPKPYDVNSKGN